MSYLGLGISILFYISLLLLLILYFIFTFNKKPFMAKKILLIMLYHSIISVLAISWSLVLINNGFDMISITVDYSIIGIFLLCILVFIFISNHYNKDIGLVYRMLIFAIYILFSFNSIIFYYFSHYLNFISHF